VSYLLATLMESVRLKIRLRQLFVDKYLSSWKDSIPTDSVVFAPCVSRLASSSISDVNSLRWCARE